MSRTESPPPRLAREGFVPAGPEKRVHKRHMLIPKTGCPEDHIPTLMDYSTVICPPERRALREIVETAEVVRENGHCRCWPLCAAFARPAASSTKCSCCARRKEPARAPRWHCCARPPTGLATTSRSGPEQDNIPF